MVDSLGIGGRSTAQDLGGWGCADPSSGSCTCLEPSGLLLLGVAVGHNGQPWDLEGCKYFEAVVAAVDSSSICYLALASVGAVVPVAAVEAVGDTVADSLRSTLGMLGSYPDSGSHCWGLLYQHRRH